MKKVNITVSYYKDHVQESFVNTHPGVRGVPLDLKKYFFTIYDWPIMQNFFALIFMLFFLDKIFELTLPKC